MIFIDYYFRPTKYQKMSKIFYKKYFTGKQTNISLGLLLYFYLFIYFSLTILFEKCSIFDRHVCIILKEVFEGCRWTQKRKLYIPPPEGCRWTTKSRLPPNSVKGRKVGNRRSKKKQCVVGVRIQNRNWQWQRFEIKTAYVYRITLITFWFVILTSAFKHSLIDLKNADLLPLFFIYLFIYFFNTCQHMIRKC